MLPGPVELRIHIYDVLLGRGSPPSIEELAGHFDVTPHEAIEAITALKIGKTLLQHPRTGEIWMAGPFSSDTTPYRVSGRSTTWFANCAWDMFGVAMIAREQVSIETLCGDCAEPIRLDGSTDTPPKDPLLVHFLVPARQWYEDIGFT